jgi:CRISPR system Cascade subunit CasB
MTEASKPADSKTFASAVQQWWGSLPDSPGDRAALRRCGTAAEAALLPAYHRLRHALQGCDESIGAERLAIVCAVLSHVREDDRRASFAAQLASGGGEKARVSGLRFRRLIALAAGDELLTGLVRAVRLLDARANVADLATSVRFWGDRVRMDWARDYYDAAPKES